MQKENTRLDIAKEFLDTLPPCDAQFGVGSALIEQVGLGAKAGQIDLLLLVKDQSKFHSEVMNTHPEYYGDKTKAFFNKKGINGTQQFLINLSDFLFEDAKHMGSDACYIPYINFKGQEFKIAVINTNDFIYDAINFNNQYMARVHKPIVLINSNYKINSIINSSRKSALLISLLLINKNKVSLFDIYHTITSLSYKGDIRMGVKIGKYRILCYENPNKIENIITGNYQEFNNMYLNEIVNDNYISINNDLQTLILDEDMDEVNKNEKVTTFLKETIVDINLDKIYQDTYLLPPTIQMAIGKNTTGPKVSSETTRFKIRTKIKLTNLVVSILQGLKGTLMLDKSQSNRYIGEKKAKGKTRTLTHIEKKSYI
jgi:hypothetical protein